MKERNLSLNLPALSVPYYLAEAGTDWAAQKLAEQFGDERPRLFVISDSNVHLMYTESLTIALAGKGFSVSHLYFEAGETHKTLRTSVRLLDELADRKAARDAVIIGFGGGVTTDMSGFVASIYLRGVRWLALPTSLMGMADAAIGGKTGVDHPRGKNLIGTFHQPIMIFAPLKLLDTLPPREWISGSAEMVKAAILSGDPLWNRIEELGPDLHSWPRECVFDAIVDAARVKMRIVAADEKELNQRRLLNLGHTFGHALEAVTRYEVFCHGEAVFLGLRAAIALSRTQGLMNDHEAKRIDAILASVDLPGAAVDPEILLEVLSHDKKTRADGLQWILLRQPGQPVITRDVPTTAVRKVAEWICEIAARGTSVSAQRRPRIVVINGPNLNLMGEREPQVYGKESYAELEAKLLGAADAGGVDVLVRQSNLEGDLVSLIQQARSWADGIIINPGGFTHSSVAIRDALSAVTLPAVEVHLSDIFAREEFRKTSLIAPVCRMTISGRGIQGYLDALQELKLVIENSAPKSAIGAPAVT